ncbi:DNRLRE domain-containing protein [Streptomyces sp. AC602_WCS936]|uniref:DNRLRE domain-containing protein n=1 Tax=Streptomyces sp. AC602_WCS936 TaxID=2823685 RepID=UPI0027E463B8|nr:DNRLRE domain-containing protein [Streptomyces sp. AC602_WCS936]
MSPYRQQAPRRRRARLATGVALLLVAEAALIAGASLPVGAAPAAEPDTTEAIQPTKDEILEADIAWAAKHAKGSKAWAITQARETGEKVVVSDETTATTYTVANPDGTLTTELTTGPERVWRDGKWQKVDVTLTAGADGAVRAKNHPEGLRLAGRTGKAPASLSAAQKAAPKDLVTLGSGEQAVTLQWKGGLPKPELDGTTARYNEAVPGADVIVEATRTGFEQYVEIAEKPSADGYSYTLPVKAKGLVAKANKDGSVSFTDAKTGVVRATMPAPVMWDASVDQRSGKHENRARVGMDVINKGNGVVDLVVTPDAAFLADPATQYPVTVDPSTSALGNLFDTYVQRGETVDWSGDTELDLGNPGTKNGDGTYRTARSFITWNTAPIADALVSKATLSLWNFHSGNTDCTAQPWEVWTANNAGTSSRWTNQPAMAAKYATSTATRGNPGCTAADGWITADVTTLAQYWAGKKWDHAGMGLRASSESDIHEWKRVNSANNAANQPKLTVTYNYRPSDGTNRQAGAPFKSYAGVWAVNTTTPTLRDTFTDPDGDQVNGTFQVYDAATNTPITTPLGEGLLLSPYGDQGKSLSVTVPAGQLKDGRTYKFRTNAYDGTHYNLNWSPWTQFVVDTTAPDEPKSISSATYPENWGGGDKGVTGVFDVETGESDARDVQWRIDPYDDDPLDAGWRTVPTTTVTRAAAAGNTASFSLAPAEVGNHTLQTRSVDRADNVGPIKDYGFTAGNRDYNRPQAVDITLPDRDTSAPQPAPSAPPQPYPFEETQPQTIRSGDLTIKLTPQKARSPQGTDMAARQLSPMADSPPDPVVKQDWCKPKVGSTQQSLITRTEACVYYRIDISWSTEVIPGVDTTTYGAQFELAWQAKTDLHGNEIKTWVQLQQIKNTFPDKERAVLFGDGDPEALIDSFCFSTGCDDGSQSSKNIDFFGDLSWDGGMNGSTPNDNHIATGSVTHTWNGNTNRTTGQTDRDKSIDMPVYLVIYPQTDIDPPPLPDGTKRSWEDKLPMPLTQAGIQVRCDKVASYGDPGCVQKLYVPTYKFNTANFPAAAAHAWLIQNKSGVTGMGKTRGNPLQYIPPKGRNHLGYAPDITSRDAICSRYRGKKATDTGWVPGKTFVPHPRTALYHTIPLIDDELNCDEFPFASTYQSAGMKIPAGKNPAPNGGADCIQTVAARTDDGTEHLLDDTRYDPPAFTENCGRSSMSGKVNQGSMSPFGKFARQLRLIDEDRYLLDPGNDWFRECDTSKADLVCTMTKP